MTTMFPKGMRKVKRSAMETSTIRGFGGGWNAIDDDLAMAPKFVKTLKNFHRSSSGSQVLRFGNQYFVDIKDVNNSPIIDQIYFNGRIINVCANGQIVTVTDAGTKVVIWSTAIAALLPGAPAAWTAGLTLVTFVPFRDTLIIHNGVDKPIVISSAFAVTYLQDLGTGSNVNVPIGKYGCTVSNYHCVAGLAGSATEIIISSKGTSGTFPLDPIPNDAISIDVGAYAAEGAATIRGIIGYRSYLIVFLQAVSLQVKLGVYNEDGDHTPEFPDTFPSFGLVGSRCITKLENDIAFAGLRGLSTASRNTYNSDQLDSSSASSIIEPAYQNAIGMLTDTEKQLSTFTVYDQLSHDLLVFIPGGRVFVYTNNEKLRYKSWSEYEGMEWVCGCTSLLGRVFLASGTKVFQLGNETFGEKYYADRLLDRDATWANATPYTIGQLIYDDVTEEVFRVLVDHVSSALGTFADARVSFPLLWEQYLGEDIDFEMELPWFDGKDPMKTKKLRFLSLATKGTSEFTFEIYVDSLYKDVNGVVIYSPALSMVFIGNDFPGFGEEVADDPYGARRSRDPRLFGFPVKFKTAKFRMHGSTKKPLAFVNISFAFARGQYIRG